MALTDDTIRKFSDGAEYFRMYLMKASTTIYMGAHVCVDTNGQALPAADTAGYKYVGIADERVTSAASGSYYVRVRTGHDVELPCTSVTQAMTGNWLYVVDDEYVDDTAGSVNKVAVGKLRTFISTTRAIVDISTSQAAATDGTAVSFATGAAVVKLAALATATVSAAIDEAYTNIDDVFCNDGDGTTTASPGTNRGVFAKAVAAVGAGVSYRVLADGAGITAKYLVACSADSAGNGVPVVTHADSNNLTRQPDFYCPSAIGAGVLGWAYRVYRQLDSGIDTTTLTAGDPVFLSSTAGQTVIAAPALGTKLIVGKALSSQANGEIEYLLPAQANPMFTQAHTVDAGEAAANLVDINTGWGVNPVAISYVITRAGIVVSGKDEVVTIGTGGAGIVRIADGGATYNTTLNDVIYLICWRY